MLLNYTGIGDNSTQIVVDAYGVVVITFCATVQKMDSSNSTLSLIVKFRWNRRPKHFASFWFSATVCFRRNLNSSFASESRRNAEPLNRIFLGFFQVLSCILEGWKLILC